MKLGRLDESALPAVGIRTIGAPVLDGEGIGLLADSDTNLDELDEPVSRGFENSFIFDSFFSFGSLFNVDSDDIEGLRSVFGIAAIAPAMAEELAAGYPKPTVLDDVEPVVELLELLFTVCRAGSVTDRLRCESRNAAAAATADADGVAREGSK